MRIEKSNETSALILRGQSLISEAFFILRSSRRPELDEPGKNPTGINYNCRIAKRTTRSFNIGIFFVSSRLANMVQVHDRANGGANNDFINGNIKC